jgi:hypothetical protein
LANPVVTGDSIATECLKRLDYDDTDIDIPKVSRVVDEWIPEVLSNIARAGREAGHGCLKLRSLQNSALMLTEVGRRRYDIPPDLDTPISVELLTSKESGSLGSSAGIGGTTLLTNTTLSATLTSDDVGRWLVLLNGPAAGVLREIVSVTTVSTAITVGLSREWEIGYVPIAGNLFMVADGNTGPLEQITTGDLDDGHRTMGTGTPSRYAIHDRVIELDIAPCETAAMTIRYYLDPLKIDRDSARMQEMLARWKGTIMNGLLAIGLQDIDDVRAGRAAERAELSTAHLIQDELEWSDFKGVN